MADNATTDNTATLVTETPAVATTTPAATETTTQTPASTTPATATPADTPAPTQTAPAQKTDGKTDGTEPPKPVEYNLTVPEDVPVNKELLTKFTDFAKTKNLDVKAAQEIVDFQVAAVKQAAEEQVRAWETTLKEWRDEVTADKEVGGANFDKSLADARAFLNAFGTPALKEVLDMTGLGNHVELIRAFAKAGKLVKEDTIHAGASATGQPKTLAERLYPTQGQK